MKFQDIVNHIEKNACTIDHFEEDSHMATNCINFEHCLIEKLPSYTDFTLCHYFYELSIPAPVYLQEEFDKYKELRKMIDNMPPVLKSKHDPDKS